MKIALDLFGGLLVLAAVGSGISKFMKVPTTMATMAHVGIKPNQIPVLGQLEVAGALGLIIGIWVKPLGILSAACLIAYFGVASALHITRKDKVKDFGLPLFLAIIAILVTYFEAKR